MTFEGHVWPNECKTARNFHRQGMTLVPDRAKLLGGALAFGIGIGHKRGIRCAAPGLGETGKFSRLTTIHGTRTDQQETACPAAAREVQRMTRAIDRRIKHHIGLLTIEQGAGLGGRMNDMAQATRVGRYRQA